MSNSNRPNNKPSHRIYAVVKRSDKGGASEASSDWTEIGAAWPHKDGKGFSLKLEYLPLNGADLSLRIPSEKAKTTEGGAA